MNQKKLWIAGIAIIALAVAALALFSVSVTAKPENEIRYEVKAENPRLNRLVMGEPSAFVDGVPAEPVHSFVWDGVGSEPIKGRAKIRVDPVGNSGKITAKWQDQHGVWELEQTIFTPPDHASGLRVGPAAGSTELVIDDPIPTFVYLHGDTTAGGPVLPTVFNIVATWGPAEVRLNGATFENPYDGPAPLWVAHTMTTVGVRDKDGKVFTEDGNIFNPMIDPSNGDVDNEDLEFHVVFHDAPGPPTGNFPPPFNFFYHLTFEDVDVDFLQTD